MPYRKNPPVPNDISHLVKRYEEYGSTLSSLEKEFGYSRYELRKRFKEAGVPIKPHLEASRQTNKFNQSSAIPPKKLLEKAYFDDGLNIKEMTVRFRIGQETLYRLFEEYGIERREFGVSVSDARRRNFNASLPDIPNLREQYATVGFCKMALAKKLNLTRYQIRDLFVKHGIETVVPQRSAAEVTLFENLRSMDPSGEWVSSLKTVIPPYELDAYSEKRRMAIEYCGLYWHSNASGGKEFGYHRDKMRACRDKGIHLITVFESDKMEIVLSIIKAKMGFSTRVGASRCRIIKPTREDVRAYESEHHVSGPGRSRERYALVHGDRIVAVMTFGRPRFSKKYEWEIVRYTVGIGLMVIGGAERLFKAFIDEHDPSSIVTYSDLRFGNGNIYGRLGFVKLRETPPNYWYFKKNIPILFHRAGFMKHMLSKRLGEGYDPGLTEWENMRFNGYDRIHDCGNSMYEWKKS